MLFTDAAYWPTLNRAFSKLGKRNMITNGISMLFMITSFKLNGVSQHHRRHKFVMKYFLISSCQYLVITKHFIKTKLCRALFTKA